MNTHFPPPRRQAWPTTLVTGATSGIGWHLSLALAHAGIPVVALGRDVVRLDELVATAPRRGATAPIHPWPADLRQTARLPLLAQAILQIHPDLGCLVNNAAVQTEGALLATDLSEGLIEDEIAVNLTTPILLSRALLPHLIAHGAGCIVNLCSGLAYAAKPDAAVYCATKAGLRMFSEALRLQVADKGVRVVDVTPPLVDTPMTAGRGGPRKMPAERAAQAILQGLLHSRQGSLHIGMARALPVMARWSPGMLRRVMAGQGGAPGPSR